nr:hypothetical protein [Planctomycetota bacterium]
MALFGKKPESTEIFVADPEQANAWFDRARQMADSGNYESAFAFFTNGFKLDPRDINVQKEVLQIAINYYNDGGLKATAKQIKQIEGSTNVEKFVTSLFIWWHDVMNAKHGIKAITAAVAADQHSFGTSMADTIISISAKDGKSLSHKELKALMHLFRSTGAWDQAIKVGQAALAAKPDDAVLERELNELAAERAMTEGGYGDIGSEEGGFRKFVKDIDKQRELEEDESLAGSAGSDERKAARAKKDFEEDPNSPDNVSTYVKILRKQDTAETIKLAFQVLMHGYKTTKQYRFRMEAADIKISMATKQLASIKEQLAANPTEELQQKFDAAKEELGAFRKTE